MALPKFYKVCQDQNGNIVPQVLGSVFNHGTAVLASLYNDDAGTIPLSNPMTSDAQYGSFKFYVNPGHYDLTFTKPGYTFEPIDDMQVPADTVTLGSMATQDASAVAITGGTATLSSLDIPNSAAVGAGLASHRTAGANKWNLFCDGTADNYLLGALGLATAAPSPSARMEISWRHADKNGLLLRVSDSDTGAYAALVFMNLGGGVVGNITTTATGTGFNTTSDVRLKHAVQALTGALAAIQALRPVAFRWNLDDSADAGFLAHELQQVIPQAVRGVPDAVNEDGSVQPQGVDHAKIVPWLTAAVKELAAQVQTLTARVADLEALITT